MADSMTRVAGPAGPRFSCMECPLRVRAAFRPFSAAELAFVQGMKQRDVTVQAGRDLFGEGEDSQYLYTVFSGWAARYRTLDGDRRQIVSIALPGDLLGLQAAAFDTMKHGVTALSTLRLCAFPRARLFELYERHPSLAHDLVWLAGRSERMADEHLLSLGRRTASQRIGYLLMHLAHRCRALGLLDHTAVDGAGFRFEVPLTQGQIADALGLSLVHTNKTLRRFQSMGIATWRGRQVSILDPRSLTAISGFDEDESVRRPIF